MLNQFHNVHVLVELIASLRFQICFSALATQKVIWPVGHQYKCPNLAPLVLSKTVDMHKCMFRI